MKKKKLPIGSILISVVLIIASVFLLRPVVEEVLRTVSLRQQMVEVEAQLTLLELENEGLQELRMKLLDPDYVKSYARANYMLTKEGEQIYYLPKSEDND
jgi:cell division protein DivIC